MKIIKVKDIKLVEKDIIEIVDKKSFLKIKKDIFKEGFIFDLNSVWYLIGTDVAYCYNDGSL